MLLVAVGVAVVMVTTAWFTGTLTYYQQPLPAKEQRVDPHPQRPHEPEHEADRKGGRR
jgi:hypothetical protein